ncbi:MAG: hypothetical protein R3B91_10280 [Planctomycetaceae bacterium]
MLGQHEWHRASRAIEFTTPDGRKVPAEEFGIGPQARLGLRETSLPGVYRAQPNDPEDGQCGIFRGSSDRHESDLTPLSLTRTATPV